MSDTNIYSVLGERLMTTRYTWAITGVAGFIGTNLLKRLLELNQCVVGLDNFSTGYRHNLEQVKDECGSGLWANFTFIEGDICEPGDCHKVCSGVDYVLHHAALGSVPRSIEDPLATNASNIDGFLNMLVAARDMSVKRFIYAASSSTYGDHADLPKKEETIGRPLSPYAVTKYVNELYADVFARCYGLQSVGLRYFNIFGPHQDPKGAYAAVIPMWIEGLLQDKPVYINGDGNTSRDFCFIDNAVQANLLAALTDNEQALNQVFNVAVGEQTSLNQLFEKIQTLLHGSNTGSEMPAPIHRDFRQGDVLHSLADISKAQQLLGYQPTHRIDEGLKETVDWYI